MAKKSVDLRCETPAAWVEAVKGDFGAFLADHANCERKASATAMSMVVRFHDRHAIIPTLIDLAIEELEHFRACYRLMQARGIALAPDAPDPYIRELLKHQRHGRDEHFMDLLLIASIVETRGGERFRLVSENMTDAEIAGFYKSLWACEARHAHVYADMALQYFDADAVQARLQELAEAEAEIIQRLPVRAALY
ncbi:MAG: tRNA-(ms[2]io[6]A)-hydroxylase [Deltaproteobacteria bacterium]|nr:MAG: tRNA-(ms[2]io[6]A)-hydroxylase [Deltaproteobacteria bacterium]